jgi:ATP-dependent Clp protease ATP-binding subunit ClpB
MKSAVMEVVSHHFRPEFINRIDEVVVFHPLIREQIRAICRIQIQNLEQRLKERDITLKVSDAALDYLGEAGFDPVYGARPLKRAIQQDLENALAQDILAGKVGSGDIVTADVKSGQMVLKT